MWGFVPDFYTVDIVIVNTVGRSKALFIMRYIHYEEGFTAKTAVFVWESLFIMTMSTVYQLLM